MPILNYTTTVQAAKTVAEIQVILTKHGARSILTNYDAEGHVESLSFQVQTPHGLAGIKLPVDPAAILKVMSKYGSGVPMRYQTREQAIRVAWRIVKDWVEAQMALLETEMVKLDQIFLPYVMSSSGKTLYQVFESHNLLLGSGEKP